MGTINSVTSPWAATLAVDEAEARHAMGASFGRAVGNPVRAEGGVIEGAAPTATASGTTCTVTGHQLVALTADGTPWVCTTLASMACPLDTVPAAGTSRFDLIVGEVVSGVYRLRSVTGTAAASPSVPAVPSNTVALFRVQVTNAGAQTPVPIMPFTRGAGAARLADYDTARAGSYVGDTRKFSTGAVDIWTGTAWVPLIAPAAWNQVAANFNYAGAGSISAGTVTPGAGGAATCRYKLTGKDLWASWNLSCGTSGVGGGAGLISTTLPAGLVAARSAFVPCVLYVAPEPGFNTIAMTVSGMAVIDAGSNVIKPNFPLAVLPPADLRETGLANAGATGTRGSGFPYVPNSFPLVPGSGLSIGPGIVEVQ